MRNLVFRPDPMLRRVCEPILRITPTTHLLLDDMLEMMLGNEGMGIAAPQVGVPERAIVVAPIKARGETINPSDCLRMINPEVVWQSVETKQFTEGCLSLPTRAISAEVVRPAIVTIRYKTLSGATETLQADGLTAVVLQHEIDHLNGILFPDRLSEPDRDALYQAYFAQDLKL